LNYDKERELKEAKSFLMENASLYNFSDEKSIVEYLQSHRDV